MWGEIEHIQSTLTGTEGPRDGYLSRIFEIPVTCQMGEQRELGARCLIQDNQISDYIIDGMLAILCQSNKKCVFAEDIKDMEGDSATIWVLSSELGRTLTRRQTRERTIAQHRLVKADHGIQEMLWPINLRGSHWIVLHVHLELQHFKVYDSLAKETCRWGKTLRASMQEALDDETAQPMSYDQAITIALTVAMELGK
eukprot:2106867-Rhodomonas_salina.1